MWTPLFFKMHNLKAASLDISVLLGVLGFTMMEFYKVDTIAATCMVPYLMWTSFAAVLTWNIYLNNSNGEKSD